MSDIWEYVSDDFDFVITSTVHMTHYANLCDLNNYTDVADYISDNINEGDCDDVDIVNVETDFMPKAEHIKLCREIKDDWNKKLNEKRLEINRLQDIVEKLEKKLKFIGGGEE